MSEVSAQAKTRRRPCRSCDLCRQRKIRCDGPTMPDNQCSHCLSSGVPCTYIHPPGKPGPRNKVVLELRQKIEILEAKLRSLSVCSLCSQPLQSTIGTSTSTSDTHKTEHTLSAETQDVEEDASEELVSQVRQWQISTVAESTPAFFGRASHLNLLQNVLAVKQKYLGRPLKPNPGLRRPIYWTQLPWENEFHARRKRYAYPSRDLITHLVDLYFTNTHPVFPILHRTSFERHVAEGLHLTDMSFGAVLLGVLAMGSRYSDDPRVMIDGNTLSSGWTFVAQLPIVVNVYEPSAYDVQFYCLMTLYSMGGSTPHIIWVYMGLSLRFVQYRKTYLRRRDGHNKFEDELWNRAFWSVFLLDNLLSTCIGRPPAMHAEEYDVDPPLEVDDEYWETGFVQPPHKPSALSFFVHFVRLFGILGKALRWLYASKRLKTQMGLTTNREKETVAELDSLMNDFLDSLPSHLRWEPNSQGTFFYQASLLHTTYYWIRLLIHRPYMQNITPFSGSSLFICVTAARSALHVADACATQPQRIPPLFLQNSVFISAVTLLLNIFATKRAGVSLHVERDLAQVQTALKSLRAFEQSSHGTGRLSELLQDLQSMDGYLSQPQRVVPSKNEITSAEAGELAHDATRQAVRQELDPQYIHAASPANVTRGEFAHGTRQGFQPGVSIEQLLYDNTSTSNGHGWGQPLGFTDSLDTELMSLWLATPAELMNVDQWDAYIDNMAVVVNPDLNWTDVVSDDEVYLRRNDSEGAR